MKKTFRKKEFRDKMKGWIKQYYLVFRRNYMDQSKLWTKDFIIISTINFLLTLVFYLLIVIMGSFAIERYDASVSAAGLVTGLFVVGTLIGRLFTGRVIDQVGRKKTLIIGLILFTAATFLYFIQIGVGFLIFSRFMHGMMLGVASTAAGTIVAQIIPPSRRGEGIGYYSMGATLATATGPFIGLMVTQTMPVEIVFWIAIVIGFVSLITANIVHVPLITIKEEQSEQRVGIGQFIELNALPISMITLIIALGYAGILSFMNLYAEEIGLVKAASFFFLVYSIAVLVTRPFTGKLVDTKGANAVMYPTFILYAAGLLLLGVAQNSFMLLLAGVLIGLGFGNMQSCIQAIAIKVTPVERAGLATSTFYIFMDAGLGLGPYLLGFVVTLLGYQQLYIALSFVVLAAIAVYYFVHGRKDRNGTLTKSIYS